MFLLVVGIQFLKMFLKLQKLTVLLLVGIVRKAYGGLRQEDELEYLGKWYDFDEAGDGC